MAGTSVWAPRAECAKLYVAGHPFPLDRGEGGWWHGSVTLEDGDDYTFILDGRRALPDPRSSWQPQGVRGASRFVDHSKFVWSDATWQPPQWENAIVYELHIGTFTPDGTFDAAIKRLQHLQKLGVTHVEVMPVGQYPGERGWGYDGVFPFAPQNTYGGPLGLKRFVDACHSHGLAVLLDVVYNHLGPSGNVLPQYGPYFSQHYHTPWGPGLNFDAAGSDEVRRYVCDHALTWLRDYHIDGLRIDSVHEMVDSSAVHILEQLVNEVRALEIELGRRCVVIGEDGKNDPRYARSPGRGGFGFDAQWSNDVGLTVLTSLTGERQGMLGDYGRWTDLLKVVSRPFVYEGQYSQHRGHAFGRTADFAAASQVVVYGQNHDFLGNRRDGDRLGHVADLDALKIQSALILLSPFTPLLFQGEEWGASSPFLFFADCHGDSELSKHVKKGRQMAAESLGWDVDHAPDPGLRETFDRSQLNWSELESESHRDLLQWYHSLIALRRRLQQFSPEDVAVRGNAAARFFSVSRGPLTIMCNFGDRSHVAQVPRARDAVILSSSAREDGIENVATLPVEPRSVVIVGPRDWLPRPQPKRGFEGRGRFTFAVEKA